MGHEFARGEIALRALFRMTGGYDADELNAQTTAADGWLRTRDLARFDERGYLHLVDRTSDMIIVGGYNVYPRKVEDVLSSHRHSVGSASLWSVADKTSRLAPRLDAEMHNPDTSRAPVNFALGLPPRLDAEVHDGGEATIIGTLQLRLPPRLDAEVHVSGPLPWRRHQAVETPTSARCRGAPVCTTWAAGPACALRLPPRLDAEVHIAIHRTRPRAPRVETPTSARRRGARGIESIPAGVRTKLRLPPRLDAEVHLDGIGPAAPGHGVRLPPRLDA